ncbi:MAG: heparinase II/III family protein [Thermaurantiacus sp.]|uniref:heparinase II/III family protein n=1 Tax=Thermaurantiacus sp. TaxID=2820283 RepID=UPI00298F09FD|nr:heparinase II/III family protein [Thermaurantiacus sp.]MDW8415471.1 heparinase II/III family protein [Thermaurantiacus sp.]
MSDGSPTEAEPPEARITARRIREGDDRGPSMAERLGERLAELRYGTLLHRMRLKGRFPLRLLGVPADPVPGDPDRGERLRAGRLWFEGHGMAIASGPLDDRQAPPAWRTWLHGWAWLRDSAAAPPRTETEARRIETLARRWLERFPDYHPEAWGPVVTARRIQLAIAHAPLLIPRHDHVHRSAVLSGIARWTRHLDRAVRRLPPGPARLEAVLGLLGGSLLVPGHDAHRARAEALLGPALTALLDDNGIVSRSPLELAILGERLLLASRFYEARALAPHPLLVDALAQVRRGLALLASGEGTTAPWHGGAPLPRQLETLGVEPAQGPGTFAGFQRLAAGRTAVVVDAAPPPVARVALAAHASTLALVLADGPVPVVVSCGGPFAAGVDGPRALALPDELAKGLRHTAAHSTLVLADTNSTRLRLDGPGRGGGVQAVEVDAHTGPRGQWLECRHDGYRRRFGRDHVRRLWLAPDGSELRGEDTLVPAGRRRGPGESLAAALRFHLAPGATVGLTSDGAGALVRLPAPRPRETLAWSFRVALPLGGRLRLEASLALAADGTARPCQQLVVEATLSSDPLSFAWAWRRQSRT